VSANSRAGHKFNLDQVVDYGPKGASKFSKAWANAVAFAEWAEARQHEEAIAARCSHKQRRGGFGARGPSHHREPIPKVVRRHAASITERPENDS
jgi:hypothetical protein